MASGKKRGTDSEGKGAKVVQLVTKRSKEQQRANDHVVTLLRKLLDQAESGEIRYVAAVVERGYGEAATTAWCHTVIPNNAETLKVCGALEVLKDLVLSTHLRMKRSK